MMMIRLRSIITSIMNDDEHHFNHHQRAIIDYADVTFDDSHRFARNVIDAFDHLILLHADFL